MITEDYVSFEVAKLLKSKKFHVPTRSHYDGQGGFGFCDICEIDWNNYKCFRQRRCYSAPTLQMAMKWLRKVHNIDISIIPLRSHKEYLPRIESDTISHDCISYRKFEDACEVAIIYCLEHIIK